MLYVAMTKYDDTDVLRSRVRQLESLGRTRLSPNFFFRDFLFSEIAAVFGILNTPDDPALAIAAGTKLCNELLEPLHAAFGKVCIRSGYRSRKLNSLGHRLRLGCASNEKNYAGHIWDALDAKGQMGATATIVIPSFADKFHAGSDWRELARWIHENLPYSSMTFYARLCAFNLQWKEVPEKKIYSWIEPRGNFVLPSEKMEELPL